MTVHKVPNQQKFLRNNSDLNDHRPVPTFAKIEQVSGLTYKYKMKI